MSTGTIIFLLIIAGWTVSGFVVGLLRIKIAGIEPVLANEAWHKACNLTHETIMAGGDVSNNFIDRHSKAIYQELTKDSSSREAGKSSFLLSCSARGLIEVIVFLVEIRRFRREKKYELLF